MSALLEVRDLTWPASGDAVLSHLDFAMEPGDRVAIVGPSGSGKSSLFRCIVGLEPFRGEVEFRGDVVTPQRVLELRRSLVLVPQTPVPVGHTLDDNLAFAREFGRHTEAEQRELMVACELAELPGDRAFDRLSVGERQRLCFVRAMTLEPQVLLLDEPTAALDAASVATIERLVSDWQAGGEGRAVVWVTHNEAQAERIADRILVLADKQLEDR